MMLVVISYDVVDDRRRTRLAKALEDFGDRVQYSVFEARLSADGIRELEERIAPEIDPGEDTVRVYRLCAKCEGAARLLGRGEITRIDDAYIL